MDLSSAAAAAPRRIVLLIDLHHPRTSASHISYISSILRSAAKILSFPPLSTSLFSIKPFFSSLSPFKSTSLVHALLGKSAAASPSFDLPAPTLSALALISKSLSFPAEIDPRTCPPRAELVAGTLHELGLKCSWDQDGRTGANLVILFSPLPRTRKSVEDFVGGDLDDLDVKVDSFCCRFSRLFSSANAVFARSDVHVGWIDVDFGVDSECEEAVGGLELVNKGIKSMGWGLCSTDAIVVGSELVPFGLIFSTIGCALWPKMNVGGRNGRAELSLEVSDTSGRPLEVTFCDLELLEVQIRKEHAGIASQLLDVAGNVKARICLKEVYKLGGGVSLNSEAYSSMVLISSHGKNKKIEKKEASNYFFADRVLKLLDTKELCNFVLGTTPFWQLILAFLYRTNILASVTISCNDRSPLIGIIKPFTIHSAVLYVLRDAKELSDVPKLLCTSDSAEVNNYYSECSSEKEKKSKKHLSKISKLSWSSFCQSVCSQNNENAAKVDLEEIYFFKDKDISKKMRFLQVWMKQMRKHLSNFQFKGNVPDNHHPNTIYETEDGVQDSQQDTDIFVSSSVVSEPQQSEGEVDEHQMHGNMENVGPINEKISEKIEEGLRSKDMDLRLLAERLVEMAIRFLYLKYMNSKQEDLDSEGTEEQHGQEIVSTVIKMLLMKPKALVAKYKDAGHLSNEPDQVSDICSKKVREHELQILFRLEILRSSLGRFVEDFTRGKIIKEICLLLENIEFNLQAGWFTGESLIEYSDRTLKARYFKTLEDVIQWIYTKMEFSYSDGSNEKISGEVPYSSNNDEAPVEKEDTNISNYAFIRPKEDAKAEEITSIVQHDPHNNEAHKVSHISKSKLLKAQEKREKDWTNKRFTSWMPKLQIVYAPKQTKTDKAMHGFGSRQVGRKRHRSSRNDMVLETPMFKKDSQSQEVSSTAQHGQQSVSKSHLSKALFLEEDDSEPDFFS